MLTGTLLQTEEWRAPMPALGLSGSLYKLTHRSANTRWPAVPASQWASAGRVLPWWGRSPVVSRHTVQ